MSCEGSWKAAGCRATLLLITILALVVVGTAQKPDTCPCSIWDSPSTPTTIDGGDGAATELGLRFRSDVPEGSHGSGNLADGSASRQFVDEHRKLTGYQHVGYGEWFWVAAGGLRNSSCDRSAYELRRLLLCSQRPLRV